MTRVHHWITALREAFTTEVLDLRKLCQWEANWMGGAVSDLVAAHIICKILFFLFSNISIQVGAILWRWCYSQGFCFYFVSVPIVFEILSTPWDRWYSLRGFCFCFCFG